MLRAARGHSRRQALWPVHYLIHQICVLNNQYPRCSTSAAFHTALFAAVHSAISIDPKRPKSTFRKTQNLKKLRKHAKACKSNVSLGSLSPGRMRPNSYIKAARSFKIGGRRVSPQGVLDPPATLGAAWGTTELKTPPSSPLCSFFPLSFLKIFPRPCLLSAVLDALKSFGWLCPVFATPS